MGPGAYRLLAGSPAIDRARVVTEAPRGMGAQDAFGASTPQGAAYDIGAQEYRAAALDPAAGRLLRVSRQSDGRWRLEFAGLAGRSYHVETSINLQTWNRAGTATEIAPRLFQFVDQSGGPARFYRAVARGVPGVPDGWERVIRANRSPLALTPAPALHVTAIWTTDADFKTPCRSFRPGGQIRWRVEVADEHQKPHPAAIVECELVSPDGKVLDHDKAMTGTDGASLFTRALATQASTGTYTVRVKVVTHADIPGATYSSHSNLMSEATFEVRP